MTRPAYNDGLFGYRRVKTRVVDVGGVPMGGDLPIRVQSMTSVDTMDTAGVVAQTRRLVEAGCEYVRVTAPNVAAAENLREIKDRLRREGITVPLVADVHYTPRAAEIAARIVEKVRVNPGNYADKKKFEKIDYTDAEYAAELERVRERLAPLAAICKEYGTAIRVGVNHGSLSDRIMSRYGDTPDGMAESALEFASAFEDLGARALAFSMKSSNVRVMVHAYRTLAARMRERGEVYPLHLGVTEAGGGEEGRIKSAAGIGALLEDGLGDTIRVSLAEDPVNEIPVAKALAARYENPQARRAFPEIDVPSYDPYEFNPRAADGVFGGEPIPVVFADLSTSDRLDDETLRSLDFRQTRDEWRRGDGSPDALVLADEIDAPAIGDAKIIRRTPKSADEARLLSTEEFLDAEIDRPTLLRATLSDLTAPVYEKLGSSSSVSLLLGSETRGVHETRVVFAELERRGLRTPVVLSRAYRGLDVESLAIEAAADLGAHFIDGYGGGISLDASARPEATPSDATRIAFGLLQATRVRTTKAEFIACPSCGRTRFDLETTTKRVQARTAHLVGLKIAVMGCIVNGPGEMADADYGYVGEGRGTITLYRGKDPVKRGLAPEEAVEELVGLIKADGKWRERAEE